MKQRFLRAAGAVLLLSMGSAGYSQQNPQLGTAAPDPKMLSAAGSDGGFGGLYAPSLYDGSLNISVPIYSYNTDAGPFGISLGYNTRGVKVDELSSDIGEHWLLNAGGFVQRAVKGLPDELNMTGNGTVWANDQMKFNRFRGRLTSSFDNATDAADTTIYHDGESDDFIVSVGGLSFTFNIGTGRAIYTNPKRNYTVELLSNGQPYADVVQQTGNIPDPLTIQFRITDPAGNQYHFIKGDWDYKTLYGDMDAHINQYPVGGYTMISRWVLDQVTLVNGRKINYTYNVAEGTTTAYKAYATDLGDANPGYSAVNRDQDISRLATISYPNGVTAQFVYDAGTTRCDQNGSALREIKIQSGSNCTRYQMDQSYTVVLTGNNTTTSEIPYGGSCVSIDIGSNHIAPGTSHRLRLKGINILSCDGSVSEPYYTFTYDPVALPLRFSAGQDWFGYYNGKGATPFPQLPYDYDITIPYHQRSGTSTQYGADRSPDISYMPAGVLRTIKNAYGGQVAFAYDANVTADVPGFTSALPTDPYFLGKGANDGLRIASVTETDSYHPGVQKYTAFAYYGGQRFLDGGYFHSPAEWSQHAQPGDGYGAFSNNFLTAHQMVNGANHGYSRVVMTVSDESSNVLSKKEVAFTNFSDSTSGNLPRYYADGKHFYEFPFTDKQYLRDWEMGLPLYTIDYDQDGRILQKTVNQYQFSMDLSSATTQGVSGTKAVFVRDWTLPALPSGVSNISEPRRMITDSYRPYNGITQLVKSTSYKYLDDNNYTTDEIRYAYDSRNNLKSTTTFGSMGEEIQTLNLYNYDMSFTIGGIPAVPFAGKEILMGSQRWQRVAGTTGSLPENGMLLDGYFASYNTISSNSPLWTRNQYQLTSLDPVSYAQYQSGSYSSTSLKANAAYNSATDIPYFRKTSEVMLFDAQGNPLETQLMGQDQYKAMVWDTTTGQKIAEAMGCHYNDIAYTSFESTLYGSNFTISNAALIGTSGVAGRKCYNLWDFSSGQGSKLTGTQNLTTDKEYTLSFWVKGSAPTVSVGSNFISLPANAAYTVGDWKCYIIRFTPAAAGALQIKGTAVSSSLDDVRLFPSSAVMSSSTYEPLYGVSSTTDATGRITTYEYDNMGRQVLTRNQEGFILSRKQYTVKGAQ